VCVYGDYIHMTLCNCT